ncbi:hypothetical protein JANAI62_36920 [Jannaschia pagri]|uniref:HTH cro/C1-type domain-containing protein n=1 Tax=Jannaschia pagri TaxID=2829797 RepID=A0ABQ4NRN0_9RHOB|nr:MULTISPECIES: hypothetical protein [unclassified Jannaschia]GIT93265.1 hypothetical protein JANAI61_37230 [Jannaschia sp. AI_61]GIT97069.1 hypothetical protein JANAI62_36920 [Jannaschia sp. AI_62]
MGDSANEVFRQAVREALKRRGQSVSMMIDAGAVSRSVGYKFFSGDMENIRLVDAVGVARYLDLSLDDLLSIDGVEGGDDLVSDLLAIQKLVMSLTPPERGALRCSLEALSARQDRA